jgi:Bacterial regulatory helix-turn-helix protein, lysR family
MTRADAPVSRLDLRKVAHFVAVVEEGSMTGAARRLGLTQQALSMSIRALERDLGGRCSIATAVAPACYPRVGCSTATVYSCCPRRPQHSSGSGTRTGTSPSSCASATPAR